jgi:hypothetical protein
MRWVVEAGELGIHLSRPVKDAIIETILPEAAFRKTVRSVLSNLWTRFLL